MKKFSIFLLIILVFSLTVPNYAQAQTRAFLFQQIEILQFEIWLLQSLLKNMQLGQHITSGSYLALNLSDNSVLLQKNMNQIYPIASITKLMTAVIVKENIKKDQTIVLTSKMLEPYGGSPSLFTGLKISSDNLLKASLTQSINDASEALAYFLGKNEFLSLMNEKAM